MSQDHLLPLSGRGRPRGPVKPMLRDANAVPPQQYDRMRALCGRRHPPPRRALARWITNASAAAASGADSIDPRSLKKWQPFKTSSSGPPH